jgi:predicted O-methyltransferase YrrM
MKYTNAQLFLKYLGYCFLSESKHGIQPPFAYDFVTKVLRLSQSIHYPDIENERDKLLKSKNTLKYKDFGTNGVEKSISTQQLAKRALKNKKYASLIAATTEFYNYKNILELGTCLGITTAYMAKTADQVVTIEGGEVVLMEAKMIWKNLDLDNKIMGVNANFDDILEEVLQQNNFDMIFIDGNHNKEATIKYFQSVLNAPTRPKCIIFDDIHWSTHMEEAWQEVISNSTVTLTLDLFFLGFAFINPNLTKQHFQVRF